MKGVFSIKVKPWEVLVVYLTHDIKYCPKTSSLKITSIEYGTLNSNKKLALTNRQTPV